MKIQLYAPVKGYFFCQYKWGRSVKIKIDKSTGMCWLHRFWLMLVEKENPGCLKLIKIKWNIENCSCSVKYLNSLHWVIRCYNWNTHEYQINDLDKKIWRIRSGEFRWNKYVLQVNLEFRLIFNPELTPHLWVINIHCIFYVTVTWRLYNCLKKMIKGSYSTCQICLTKGIDVIVTWGGGGVSRIRYHAMLVTR